MISNEILEEKYKVQKRLSKKAKNIHDYFLKAHQATENFTHKDSGIKYHETTPPQHMVSEKTAKYNSKSGEKPPDDIMIKKTT